VCVCVCVESESVCSKLKCLNKWASIALDWQNNPKASEYTPAVKTKVKRDKIRNYSEKIQAFLELNGGSYTISQRTLAKNLDIPFTSFCHALKRIAGLSFKPFGIGRNAKTYFKLRKESPHLRLIHQNTD